MFARHEDAVRVATSLFGLISQDFRIDKVTTILFHTSSYMLWDILFYN